jgi:hypothetical protein
MFQPLMRADCAHTEESAAAAATLLRWPTAVARP